MPTSFTFVRASALKFIHCWFHPVVFVIRLTGILLRYWTVVRRHLTALNDANVRWNTNMKTENSDYTNLYINIVTWHALRTWVRGIFRRRFHEVANPPTQLKHNVSRKTLLKLFKFKKSVFAGLLIDSK